MKTRNETDTLGTVAVPATSYWGAQTQRSLQNFAIGNERMPIEVIRAYGVLKKAAARANAELGGLAPDKAELIIRVCDEILAGDLDTHFPLSVWQTGSGTQTNMNVNEVIANRAHVLSGHALGEGKPALGANDDVNRAQSSNDSFPTAMHVAAYTMQQQRTLPALRELHALLDHKAGEFASIVKSGRTHLMDAVPLTLGQEFSGYAAQVGQAVAALEASLDGLLELALGGTAVGTGLNAPPDFADRAIAFIAADTGYGFRPATNTFAALAAHDALVRNHAALKSVAVVLHKLANDIRLAGSGPRTGLGELQLPANEPGSSIMPGKVNPTQCEALIMVCMQVMGNDVSMAMAGAGGQFELNTCKPLMIATLLQSAGLLADCSQSFARRCLADLQPNPGRIAEHLENSLMLVTALNPHIGYYKAAEIAQKAHAEKLTLREAAIASGYVSEDEFDTWVDPRNML